MLSHHVLRGVSKSGRDKRIPTTNGWIWGRFVLTWFLHWSCWQWVSPRLRGEQQRSPAPPPLGAPARQEKEKSSLLLPPSFSFIEHCWMCAVLSLSLLHRHFREPCALHPPLSPAPNAPVLRDPWLHVTSCPFHCLTSGSQDDGPWHTQGSTTCSLPPTAFTAAQHLWDRDQDHSHFLAPSPGLSPGTPQQPLG